MSLGLLRAWQIISVIRHRIQARTAANFRLRIALLVLFSVLNVGLGGLLYKWIAAEESWSQALFTVYAVSVHACNSPPWKFILHQGAP